MAHHLTRSSLCKVLQKEKRKKDGRKPHLYIAEHYELKSFSDVYCGNQFSGNDILTETRVVEPEGGLMGRLCDGCVMAV
jgi:hypothetical protein